MFPCFELHTAYYQGPRDRVFYENLPAEDAVIQGQCDEAEVVIVDPPRRGLDEGVIDLFTGRHPAAKAEGKHFIDLQNLLKY